MREVCVSKLSLNNEFSCDFGIPFKTCISVLEKKIRNLEKRKGKLDGYKDKVMSGEKLDKDQMEAVEKYDVVVANMEFARELLKQYQTMNDESEKQAEKLARKKARVDKLQQQQRDIQLLSDVLLLQRVLDMLGTDEVRAELCSGESPHLTDSQALQLDDFYDAILPSTNTDVSVADSLMASSEHLLAYIERSDKTFGKITYHELHDIVENLAGTILMKSNIKPFHTPDDTVAEANKPLFDEDSQRMQQDEISVKNETQDVVSDIVEVVIENSPPVVEEPRPDQSITVVPTPPQSLQHRPQSTIQDLLSITSEYDFLQDSMLDNVDDDDDDVTSTVTATTTVAISQSLAGHSAETKSLAFGQHNANQPFPFIYQSVMSHLPQGFTASRLLQSSTSQPVAGDQTVQPYRAASVNDYQHPLSIGDTSPGYIVVGQFTYVANQQAYMREQSLSTHGGNMALTHQFSPVAGSSPCHIVSDRVPTSVTNMADVTRYRMKIPTNTIGSANVMNNEYYQSLTVNGSYPPRPPVYQTCDNRFTACPHQGHNVSANDLPVGGRRNVSQRARCQDHQT